MKPVNFLFFFLIFFSKITFIKSSECSNTKYLNVGLLKYEHIDYEPYLYYELGKYALKYDKEFNLEFVNKNYDDFDIIFGEYFDLKKFKNQDLTLTEEILDFYKTNNIQIISNTLPLDLDTFIILSKDRQEKLTFDNLSNFYSPFKYSLGINLLPKDQFIKLITYSLKGSLIEKSDINLEYLLSLYSNIYKNINMNIINSNFIELVESFDSYENTFTVFNDGILLNKNIDYKHFQIFPHTKFNWSDFDGFFKESSSDIPISFFGFSAYINNQDSLGFFCHLIDRNIRNNTFRNFNLQVSPLSEKEVDRVLFDIPNDYIDILEKKNQYIYELSDNSIENYEYIIQVLSKKKGFDEIIETINYLK